MLGLATTDNEASDGALDGFSKTILGVLRKESCFFNTFSHFFRDDFSGKISLRGKLSWSNSTLPNLLHSAKGPKKAKERPVDHATKVTIVTKFYPRCKAAGLDCRKIRPLLDNKGHIRRLQRPPRP